MIPEEIKDKILDACAQDLPAIVGKFIDLQKKGANYIGECPFCHAKKLNVSESKNVWKCFKCEQAGKGAVSFLMNAQNMEYVPAIKYLGDLYNISTNENAKAKAKTKKKTFRDLQLSASGITNDDQKWTLPKDKDTTKIIDRYQSASLDKWSNIVPGDDMVMTYIDLQGEITTFQPSGKGKERPLYRVRWQVPGNHLDKSGNPIKYQSPYQSGSHLWLTNKVIRQFQRGSKIKRLFIQEGEKKADKATKHGLISVGIMGINNISMNHTMPHDFQRLLNTCQIEEVVFVLDADYHELSSSLDKNVESRPKQFLSAVRKFRDYFYQFQATGIKVKIYLAYIKPNDFNSKGIDDLLMTMMGEEELLKDDFDKAMLHPDGKGERIDCIEITAKSEHQLREMFSLHSKEAFLNYHKTELVKRGVFKYHNVSYRYDEEKDEFVLDQPLLPDEEYWEDESYTTSTGRPVKKLSFSYANCYHFLRNRGYGRFQIGDNARYRFVHLEKNIVKEVETFQIKDYLIQFTEAIDKKDVLEMLYRGAKMYVGPDSLSNLKYVSPDFHESGNGLQYLYFKNEFWRITDEGVKALPIDQLDKAVWSDNILDFKAECHKPLLTITQIDQEFIESIDKEDRKKMMQHYGKYQVEISEAAEQSDFFVYLHHTSNFFFYPEASKRSKQGMFGLKSSGEFFEDLSNQLEVNQHLLSKMTAIGYLLHHYRDSSTQKAVVAMDGKLSEVGQSNGRTGKSILGDALEKMLPTVTIPGKKNKLTEDDFLFSKVDERTRLVFIDDARTNIDFEFFFPMITGRLDVNRKGKDAFSLTGKDVPKLLITTNHALNGEGSSFNDRQHLIAFSDWYSDEYKPVDDFGKLFFDEWDHDQWNRFYNLMAECLKLYFQLGLVPAPDKRLEQRRLRQAVGEAMIDWADMYYDEKGNNINKRLERASVYRSFIDAYPKQKMYVDAVKFKRKLKAYCNYAGLEFNPGYPSKKNAKAGGDCKSNGVEYFIVANDNYDPEQWNPDENE